jgi:hypothetical protein
LTLRLLRKRTNDPWFSLGRGVAWHCCVVKKFGHGTT